MNIVLVPPYPTVSKNKTFTLGVKLSGIKLPKNNISPSVFGNDTTPRKNSLLFDFKIMAGGKKFNKSKWKPGCFPRLFSRKKIKNSLDDFVTFGCTNILSKSYVEQDIQILFTPRQLARKCTAKLFVRVALSLKNQKIKFSKWLPLYFRNNFQLTVCKATPVECFQSRKVRHGWILVALSKSLNPNDDVLYLEKSLCSWLTLEKFWTSKYRATFILDVREMKIVSKIIFTKFSKS